jgi:hypothetical protein
MSRLFTHGLRRGLHSLRRFAAVPMSLRRERDTGARTDPGVQDGVENNGLNDYRAAVAGAGGDNFL